MPSLLQRLFRRRRREPQSGALLRYNEFRPTSFGERLAALNTLHTLRSMHMLLAGAAGRLRWEVHSTFVENGELTLYSELLDAYAAYLFADWMVLGEARWREGFVRDLYEYEYSFAHPAPPLEAAAVLLQKMYELERAEYQAFWRQGASVFAVVAGDKSHVALPSQVEEARKTLQDRVRAAGAGGIEVLPLDIEFREIQRGLASYDFPTQKVHLVRELCNLFAVDSSLLNDPQNKTYSNKTEAQKALFVNVIIPNAYTFAKGMTRTLRAAGRHVSIEVGLDEIESIAELRLQNAKALLDLYEAGLISREEARIGLGYE